MQEPLALCLFSGRHDLLFQTICIETTTSHPVKKLTHSDQSSSTLMLGHFRCPNFYPSQIKQTLLPFPRLPDPLLPLGSGLDSCATGIWIALKKLLHQTVPNQQERMVRTKALHLTKACGKATKNRCNESSNYIPQNLTCVLQQRLNDQWNQCSISKESNDCKGCRNAANTVGADQPIFCNQKHSVMRCSLSDRLCDSFKPNPALLR